MTIEILGDYYEVGGLNPPYYYEDIDNDGIKDILIIDHGKEADPDWRNWSAYNVFFKGTSTGFKKTEIKGLTDTKAYYHGHDVADFDNDGDLDIITFNFHNQANGVKSRIMWNDGTANFSIDFKKIFV